MPSISLGHVAVTVDASPPSGAAPPSGQLGPTPRNVSLDEAVRTTGFTILQPTALPAGSRLDLVQQIVAPPPSGTILGAVLVYSQRSTRWIAIQQRPYAGIQRVGVPIDVQEVTVAGRPAAVVVRDVASTQSRAQFRLLTMFIEVGELLVTLAGANLSQEDAIGIAASLQ